MIAARCSRCGYIGCNGNNIICSPRIEEIVERHKESLKIDFGEKQIKTENPFTSISVSVSDVMIDTLSNDAELGSYVRGLLNKTR